MKTLLFALMYAYAASGPARSLAYWEPPHGCFRSVAEAVAQTHALDPEQVRTGGRGFRLEDVRRDPLMNRRWAMVKSCEHPEQPPIAVVVPNAALAGNNAESDSHGEDVAGNKPIMQAGATVRLVRLEAKVRLEMPAVAVSNGSLGERIRVRVVRSTGFVGEANAGELILVGIVRGPDVLELEP